MTEAVKAELARAVVGRACCRRAEVATVLRFAGGASVEDGQIVVAAELDTAAAAQRLRTLIGEAFTQPAQLAVLAPTRPRESHRWAVRVTVGGESLARRAGLVDEHGLVVRGLPPHVVTGALCDAEALWRGALLARGSLSEPGKSRALSITCPGADGALLSLALTGAARRLGASARAREVRGVEQVTLTDTDAITVLLTRVGAPAAATAWAQARARTERSAAAARDAAPPTPFTAANQSRSVVAARTAAARLTRALEILDGDVPAHVGAAVRLRIAHPEITLDQLGALCDPPLTKDAIAGLIRRVLALADKRAIELGIPTATGATSPERSSLTPRCQ